MRIGMLGTFWDRLDTGSGQYLRQLCAALQRLAPELELDVYVPRVRQGAPADPTVAPEDRSKLWLERVVAPPAVGEDDAPRQSDGAGPGVPPGGLAKLWFEQVAYPRACGRSENKVDLLHVPYFAPPFLAPVPVVVTIHDLIPLLLPAYRGSALVRGYTRLVSRAARHAALVLTDSQASSRDIQRLLGIPAERIQVIYLAADEAYRPLAPDARQPVLARLGIVPPYLLYLGGFDVRKNVEGLLRAYARARERLGRTRMVIAGRLPAADSAFTPDPRRIARELGLADTVCFTGWVDERDKPALYAGATAFVFPSHYEGFGLPVLEAISCGTPAIVGAGSSLEEIAGPGGLAVPPTDVDALAQAMVRLAGDSALRERMSHQGLAHARTFSWERTARETLEAYHRVLATAGGREKR